jgi:hypothetical protein
MGPQTTDHLLWDCELLREQKEVLKNSIMKAGGDWPDQFRLSKQAYEIVPYVCELYKYRNFVISKEHNTYICSGVVN